MVECQQGTKLKVVELTVIIFCSVVTLVVKVWSFIICQRLPVLTLLYLEILFGFLLEGVDSLKLQNTKLRNIVHPPFNCNAQAWF